MLYDISIIIAKIIGGRYHKMNYYEYKYILTLVLKLIHRIVRNMQYKSMEEMI